MATDDEEPELMGTWRIEECVSLSGQVEQIGIEGSEFTLHSGGELTWKISDKAEALPFFTCETYEFVYKSVHPDGIKLCGRFGEEVVQFKMEVSSDDEKLMLLTYERCCMLQCQKVADLDVGSVGQFSFLQSLQEGYFSDQTISSDSGKKFKVHKVLLNLGYPEVKCTPFPLEGLAEEVIHSALHYGYAECLPEDMSESTAKKCIKCLEKIPGFGIFLSACKTFLENVAVKQQFISIIGEIHASFDKVIELCIGKGTLEHPEESILSNPAKLCFMFKEAIREICLAGSNFVLLCDIFSRRKCDLSREERHELMKYANTRVPIILEQIQKLLKICHTHLGAITHTQEQDIGAYLVQEIEDCLTSLSVFISDTQDALDMLTSLCTVEKKEKRSSGNMEETLRKTIRKALHMRELLKIKRIHQEAHSKFLSLKYAQDRFMAMSRENKIRIIARDLSQFQDDIAITLRRMEELSSALSTKLSWRDWKYMFKFVVSKVTWGLSKAQEHKSVLQSVLNQSRELIHRDQFDSSLIRLGLLETKPSSTSSSPSTEGATASVYQYSQSSAIESLCIPPSAKCSKLARRAKQLFRDQLDTDMVFDVMMIQESGDVVVDHTHDEPITRTDHTKEVDVIQVKGHCVIIASRCDWFRRALLSGMRESIERKITVHDTQPGLFRTFLEYLYCGELDSALSVEQLADMLAISDKYEVENLKLLCEDRLLSSVNTDCCLFLLSVADQYIALKLKKATLDYISEYPDIVDSDVFNQLPSHLQSAVEDAVIGLRFPSGRNRRSNQSKLDTTSSSSSSGDLADQMAAMAISHASRLSSSSSSDDMDDPLVDPNRTERLNACITALRAIVGPDADHDELVQVAMSADYDVNRAVNYFYMT